jgi:hypothetical protein
MYSGLVLSDLHIGNSRTPSSFIITNITKFFNKYRRVINGIDYLFIVGDFYDKLLTLASNDAIQSIAFMNFLVDFCISNKIKLRVLEGTKSHDYNQPLIFQEIYKNVNVDFKYFSTIAIEHDIDKDIYILYVPDDLYNTREKYLAVIKELLEEHQLTTVDLALMHGAFDYQLPIKTETSFLPSDFNFVKEFIFIGHIHSHKPYKNIIPPGSFDRLRFNEEEKKGGIYFKVDEFGKEYRFLENKYAMEYKRVKIKSIKQLKRILSRYRGRFIEIEFSTDYDLAEVKKIGKEFGISIDIVKKKSVKEKKVEVAFEQFAITKDNVYDLLYKRINPEDKELFKEELMDLIY